jgi:hypothetical protein
MRFACWITKGTDSEYVILNAFPRQQWLREGTSMLRYTYTACLVICFLPSHVRTARTVRTELRVYSNRTGE